MKRPSLVVVVGVFVALVLGWTIGEFFTGRTVAKVVASIPASPIVVDAKYDKTKHAVIYSITNPGGVPITIVDESFVFTPGSKSKEKAYVVSHIPVKIEIPPRVTSSVELKLKSGTENLKVGDAVLATFTYVYPLSKDIYTVVHLFTMGVNSGSISTSKKGGNK